MTERFGASSPGPSSQFTTQIEGDVRNLWQSSAAIRVSGCMSHPGLGTLHTGRTAPGVS